MKALQPLKEEIVKEIVSDFDLVSSELSKSKEFKKFTQEEVKEKLLITIFIESRKQFYFQLPKPNEGKCWDLSKQKIDKILIAGRVDKA